MIVMVPVRLTGRRITRLVNSEYRSKIWSTGALKNSRENSARSASPGAVGLAAIGPRAGKLGELSGAGGLWARGRLGALDNAPAEPGLFGVMAEADCLITRGDTSTRILFPSAPTSAGFCNTTVPPSPTRVCAVPTS